MDKPVTDPKLIARLNSRAVTDQALIEKLNRKAELQSQMAAEDKRRQEYLDGWNGPVDNPLMRNIGAGMDNLWQGVKQLSGNGDDDATIDERRRIKQHLADSMPGGGVAQFAGETLAGAPLGAGVGSVVGKGLTALPMVGKALARVGGMGGRSANLGLAGRGAVEGAVGGAATEVKSNEDRASNVILGAGMGGVLPLALAGGAKTRQVFSKKAAPERAAKVFEKTLGKDNVDAINQAVDSPRQFSLPLSTAARADNPSLAALERGARTRGDWAYDHDLPVAQKAWADLQGATGNADELGSRVADREAMMSASRGDFATHTDPTLLRRASNDLTDDLQALRGSAAARQNPELTAQLNVVEQMLKHPQRTGEDYASQYWRLSKQLEDTKLSTEMRGGLMKLRDSVHASADTATDGKFSDMLGRYMAEEAHVAQSEGSKALRNTFASDQGVTVPGVKDLYGTPVIESNRLRGALAKKGENEYGDVLAPSTRSGVEDLQKELTRHELYKASNSPGSTSLSENQGPVATLGSGANNPFNRIWALRGMSNLVLGKSRQATVQAADEALRDPQVWKAMMEQYAKSNSPLTPQEYAERAIRQLMLTPGRAGTTALGGE